MATPANPFVDPFAGNQVTMSADTFKQALNALKAPVGTPGRQGLSDYVYAAAMIVDMREDALMSVQGKGRNGSKPPNQFYCPTCEQGMINDYANQSIVCHKCGRGVSLSFLERLFRQGSPVAPGTYQKPTLVPTPVTPSLTAAVPLTAQVDPSKAKATTVEHGKPSEYWRAWQIDLSSPKPILLSSNHKLPWPAKEPSVAVHDGSSASSLGEHESPNWHCVCGLYAVKTILQAQKWANTGGYLQVVGKVAMWGTLHLYSEGVRSSHAYPKEIWIPSGEHWEKAQLYYEDNDWTAERLRNELAALYGIEVHIDDGMFNIGLS